MKKKAEKLKELAQLEEWLHQARGNKQKLAWHLGYKHPFAIDQWFNRGGICRWNASDVEAFIRKHSKRRA